MTLIDLGSKFNIIHFAYSMKLGLYTRKINVDIQKINNFYLDIFRIVIVDYLVKKKLEKV